MRPPVAAWIDGGDTGDDAAAARAAVLLPVVNVLASEAAFTNANLAREVLGGAGYTREWPVARRYAARSEPLANRFLALLAVHEMSLDARADLLQAQTGGLDFGRFRRHRQNVRGPRKTAPLVTMFIPAIRVFMNYATTYRPSCPSSRFSV